MVPMPKDRPSRNPLLFGALLVAVMLAAMGLLGPDWGEEALDTLALAAEHSVDASRSADLPIPVPEANTGRESTAPLPLELPAPASEEALSEREYPVHGTFVMTDCFGQEHADLDGQFELITRFGGVREVRAIELSRGSFEFMVPDPSHFFVHDLELSEIWTSLELEKELSGPHGDQLLLLRARDQCQVSLEVLDAMTHAQLTGVDVWEEGELDSSARSIPVVEGLERVVIDGSSPLFLPEVDLNWGTVRTYWVRVEGYAWGKVNVDHTRVSDHTIRLSPGSTLRVKVEGLEQTQLSGMETWLYLRRLEDDELLAYKMLDRSFTHSWRGVSPGSYRVCVDLGFYWGDPLPLGSAEVELGTSAEASIVVTAVPAEAPLGPVQVSGTVRAHEFWREQKFSMEFHGRGETERWEGSNTRIRYSELSPDRVDPDLFYFSKELPCEGSWQVNVGFLGVHEDFEATSSGAQGIEVTIPPPAELSISARDAETGHALTSVRVWYRYTSKSESKQLVWPDIEYRPESGTHHMSMPAGRATMIFSAQGFAEIEEELDITPGHHELAYELEPRARVDLEFMEGVTAIPVSLFDVEIEATPEEGDGEIAEVWFRGLVFTEPGSYRVRISGIKDYLELETTLQVPERGVVSHLVQLVRE